MIEKIESDKFLNLVFLSRGFNDNFERVVYDVKQKKEFYIIDGNLVDKVHLYDNKEHITDKEATQRYNDGICLLFTYRGNGMCISNINEEEHNDYKTIAHLSDNEVFKNYCEKDSLNGMVTKDIYDNIENSIRNHF